MLAKAAFRPRRQNSHRGDTLKRCEPYLRWLRRLPCFLSIHDKGHVCEGMVRACHFDPFGDKGEATKVSDAASLPMCDGAHAEQTDRIGWPEFQRKYAFDGGHVVIAYWMEWLGTMAGKRWAAEHPEAVAYVGEKMERWA
jgi:hypothetical protein